MRKPSVEPESKLSSPAELPSTSEMLKALQMAETSALHLRAKGISSPPRNAYWMPVSRSCVFSPGASGMSSQ